MKQPESFDDDVLLAALSMVIDGMDPVPSAALRVALAAAEISNAENELAALVADAAVGEALVLRDDADSLLLTFRSTRMSVEIEVDRDGQAVGLISPPTATVVEVEDSSMPTPGGTSIRSDDLGRFRIDLGAGMRRLRIGCGPEAIVTSWFYC